MRMLRCSTLILSTNHTSAVAPFLRSLPINGVDFKMNVMYCPTEEDRQIADACQNAHVCYQRDLFGALNYIGSRKTIRVSGSLASSMRDTSSRRTRTGRMPHHVPLKASKRSQSRLVPRGLHNTIVSRRDKILHSHPACSHRWYIYASSSRS